MKVAIKGGLIVLSLILAWLIYDSVNSKIEFQELAETRKAVVVEKLKDIRTAQVSYKSVRGAYAPNFENLISHVKYDSMPIIKAIGNVPDTLTEVQAVQMGIVIRDTFKIAVRDTLFNKTYPIDSLRFIPFSDNAEFTLQSGEIEKNRVKVKVFEAFASYKNIFNGIDLSNENIKLGDGLRVGSITEATTNGNWE